MFLLAYGHTECNTPTLFRGADRYSSNRVTPLVSMQLGHRAGFRQTRCPLICVRAFSFASSYPYTTLTIASKPLVSSVKATSLDWSHPPLWNGVATIPFRKGVITSLVGLRSLPPPPCLRATMDTVHHSAWMSLLGWFHLLVTMYPGCPRPRIYQWVRWRPNLLAVRPSRRD